MTIAIPEDVWSELTSLLDLEQESAAFIVAGLARDEQELTFLARLAWHIPPDGYDERSRDRLVLRSARYVEAIGAAARDGAVPVFVHTHPRGRPMPSAVDRQLDIELAPVVRIRTGQGLYVRLVVGGTRSDPSVWAQASDDKGRTYPLRAVRVVGSRLQLFAPEGSQSPDAFDRQVQVFGERGQALLSVLHVGVAGAGATGSAVVEQLLRLGVGRISVVDDDIITPTNITRIHESGRADIGQSKIDLTVRAAARIGLGSVVIPILGRTTNRDVAWALRQCDVVIGCTDDQAGRGVLSRLAYWYLLPVIDLGVVIEQRRAAAEIYARITVAAIGGPCLVCRGRVDLDIARAEELPVPERDQLINEGYVRQMPNPAPSVVTYTTLVAALGINELLGRLFGYLSGDGGTEVLARLDTRELRTIAGNSKPDHYCVERKSWGKGDGEAFLGRIWP
jgi:molybdopterin/thiamine biosynthesis adenylyltransferase